MDGKNRVSHENDVFEAPPVEAEATDGFGRPTPADAIPQPADPQATGDDAYGADEDVDETMAGGLGDPPGRRDTDA